MLRTLIWPVVALLITGMWHFTAEAVWPGLQDFFVPAVLAPLLLAYGLWAGYRAAQAGAGFLGAAVAGAVLGLLPLALDTLGFGVLLGRGLEHGLMAGVFGLSVVVFGALIGGGVVESRTLQRG